MRYTKFFIIVIFAVLSSGCASKQVKLNDPLGFIPDLDDQVQIGLSPLEDCDQYNLGVAQINYQIFQLASQACSAKQQESGDSFFRPRAFVKCVSDALKLHAVDPKNCNEEE